MSLDRDEEDDKAKDKDKDQKQPKANPNIPIVQAQNMKQPKSYIAKYFNSMASRPPIIYTPKEKQKCDTIMAQHRLYTTECKALNQGLLRHRLKRMIRNYILP